MAPFITGRPPTLAPSAMVVSPNALATAAGVDVLRAGGSAVDAAIAVSSTLSVIYPHMTGIGGDAFWLIHDAATKQVRFLNGGGKAARQGELDWFRSRKMEALPLTGLLPATLTVPGAVASWCAAHEAYGKLPLKRVLAQATDYAQHGFPLTGKVAAVVASSLKAGLFNRAAQEIFAPGGSAPRGGTKLVNRGLGAVLARIADSGREGFYGGETAKDLADFARAEGGFFDEADLKAQTCTWGTPLESTYRGLRILETPPPTQGFTVLQMLNLLEPYALGEMDPLGADAAHLLVQAKQISYCDRDALLADPEFADVPVARLISKSYANQRRGLIRPERALAWDEVPSYGSLNGDTTFIAVVDPAGNAVALIHSVYTLFGSGVVAGKTGVLLQNRSAYFSLDPAHPNRLQPGKRPLHTLIASMAFQEGKLRHLVGCMGADGQPQIHVQTYTRLVDFGWNIQEAVEGPRWLSGRYELGEPRDLLNIEGRFPEATLKELARRGHVLNRWPDFMERAGHAHGISIDPESGILSGGADPRSDGAAIGF